MNKIDKKISSLAAFIAVLSLILAFLSLGASAAITGDTPMGSISLSGGGSATWEVVTSGNTTTITGTADNQSGTLTISWSGSAEGVLACSYDYSLKAGNALRSSGRGSASFGISQDSVSLASVSISGNAAISGQKTDSKTDQELDDFVWTEGSSFSVTVNSKNATVNSSQSKIVLVLTFEPYSTASVSFVPLKDRDYTVEYYASAENASAGVISSVDVKKDADASESVSLELSTGMKIRSESGYHLMGAHYTCEDDIGFLYTDKDGKIYPQTGAVITPVFIYDENGVAPFSVDGRSYWTWETAFGAANGSGIVVLTDDYELPSTYSGSNMTAAGVYVTGADNALVYTVPQGVTLLLPYSDSDLTIYSGTSQTNDFKHANVTFANNTSSTAANMVPSYQVLHELTVPSGSKLLVKDGTSSSYGRIVVGGTIIGGEGSAQHDGATYGSHSNLVIDGVLELGNYAVLSVTGYVYGDGEIKTTGSKAKIYQPMVIRDWRGAGVAQLFVKTTVSSPLATKSGEEQISPYSQWGTYNIQTKTSINSGNYMYAYATLREDDKAYCSHPVLIGDSSETGFVKLNSGAVLVTEYDLITWPSTYKNGYPGKTTITITGGASFGSLALSVQIAGVGGFDVNTSSFTAAISYCYDINLVSGQYSIENSMAILPGVVFTIAEDAVLSVGKENSVRFMIFDGLLHKAKQNSSTSSNDWKVEYSTSRGDGKHYPTTSELQAAKINGTVLSGDAEFIVNGKLVIGANAMFGGVVQTDGGGIIDATEGIAGDIPKASVQIAVTGYKYIFPYNRCFAGMVLHERTAQIVGPDGSRMDIVRGNSYNGMFFETKQASYSFKYYAEAANTSNVVLVGNVTASSGETVSKAVDAYALNETIYGAWCIAMSEEVTLDSMFYLEDYVWFDGVMDVPVYKGEGTLTLISLDDRLQLPLIDGKPVADENGGLYVVRQMEAKSLSQKIKFQVMYTNGSTVLLSNVLVIDFQEYADAYIEANKNSQDENIQKKVALVTVMKTYGDAAEIYFDEELKAEYNADESITFPDTITLEGAKDTVMGFTGGAESGVTGASLKTNSAKVYFDEALRMSVFFTPTLPTDFDTENIVKIGLLATSGTGTLTMANHETMYVLYSPTPPGTLGGSGNYPEEDLKEAVNGTITSYNKLPDRDAKDRWELCFDLTNDMYGQVYELRPFMIVEDETGTHYVYGEQVHYSLAAYISRTYEKADNAFKNLLTATWDYVVAADAAF